MGEAFHWGAIAGASLVLGGFVALRFSLTRRQLGLIMAFGAGVPAVSILGGAFFMDLPDLDEAIRLAALIPTAKHGSIEIRPVLQ